MAKYTYKTTSGKPSKGKPSKSKKKAVAKATQRKSPAKTYEEDEDEDTGEDEDWGYSTPKAKAEAPKKKVDPEKYGLEEAWWNFTARDEEEPHERMVSLIKDLFAAQDDRYHAYIQLMKAFGADLTARGGDVTEFRKAFDEGLSMNHLANTIETMHSEIYRHRLMTSCATTGGDYDAREQGKDLNRWLDGVYENAEVHHEKSPKAGLLAFIVGTCFLRVGHTLVEKNLAEIDIDVVEALDIVVDPSDAADGKPMCIFQISRVDRGALYNQMCRDSKTLWGTKEQREQAILEGDSWADCGLNHSYSKDGLLENEKVVTFEGWRRANADGTGGVYIYGTSAGTLIAREYPFKEFPHIPWRWKGAPTAFYGQSAVARLIPGQREYNKLCLKGQKAHDLLCKPRILVRKNSGFQKHKIDDKLASVWEADDVSQNAIREWNPQPIHPDFYRERDSLPDKMRALLGVSGYADSAEIPSQLREISGVALTNMMADHSSKHAMSHLSHERSTVALSYRVIDEAEWLQKHKVDVEVRTEYDGQLNKLNFSKVQMDRKNFKLNVLPVSHQARTFAARVAEFSPLRDKGDISEATYRRLIGNPDNEAESDMLTSKEEMCDKMLNHVFKTGESVEFLSFDDPDLTVQRGAAFINIQRMRGCRPEKLAPVIEYVESAYLAMEKRAAAQSKMMQGPQAGVPAPPALSPGPDPLALPPGPMPGGMPPGPGMGPDMQQDMQMMPPGVPGQGVPPGTLQ